jgi:hypothetical protein
MDIALRVAVRIGSRSVGGASTRVTSSAGYAVLDLATAAAPRD